MAVFTLAIAALALLAAGGGLVHLRRLRQEQRELQRTLHDRGLALDRRCDALQEQLDALALHQRIDRLGELVELSRRRGLFGEGTAEELTEQIETLRRESLRRESLHRGSPGGSDAPGV